MRGYIFWYHSGISFHYWNILSFSQKTFYGDENMLITNHQRNADQNHNGILPHTC